MTTTLTTQYFSVPILMDPGTHWVSATEAEGACVEVKRYMEAKEVERIIAMPQWEEVMMLVKKSLFMI